MRKKHNLRLARAIQGISGVLAVLTIYPLVRLIYPCWRRLKGRGNHGETGGAHSSGPSEPHGGPSEPSGKSTAQGK
ncbi:MAG: hypothetical protein OXI19_07230 [Gemmatimonadota bacterium]|nr:hypothetical protein [Gemmatimonadota bacterium]MXW05362.1 hypothetical protein [Gemmatimonadota bacterium]MYB59948.1 hypothetical protein [Gemmatimonadota bacterium]